MSLLDAGLELNRCEPEGECEVKLNNETWMARPILKDTERGGWKLYSLVDVDQATIPVTAAIRRIFLWVALICLVTTLFCSFLSSRAMVQPIAAMVSHLHHSANTGVLPEFGGNLPTVFEVKELARSYNLAAASVRTAQDSLQGAYIEFVYSLANALDARDKYTAGHSKRVSDLCCAIAGAMGQTKEDVDRLRIGALLHDIGKIGVSDLLLQKPGRLTDDEFATIKRHPVIGRRILQGVQGFAKYLPAVELHHENWNGTGYPKRQRGEETPLDARIIHVADAYDAMTTDRAYRNSMTHDRAIDILTEHAGTQFDPDVVAALISVSEGKRREASSAGVASPRNRPVAKPAPEPIATILVHHQEGALLAHQLQMSKLDSAKLPVC
jgi:putative nucleotidyltransferase with HDIG domain